MIPVSKIDEIRQRMDIVEVVSDYVQLKKSGSSYKALSPFANEKTPSFFVVPSKGIFKCFSSGKGGDALRFVMEIESMNYVEALRYLAKKYGISWQEEEPSGEQLIEQNKRESLFIILQHATTYFKNNLWQSEEGKTIGYSYFKERGFSDETISLFDLGYARKGWDHYLTHALQDGYQPDLIEAAGLTVKNDNRQYDRFRERVIFPIHNPSGRILAFGARIMGSDKSQPKYINSPESDIYQKSSVLYGLFQCKQGIRHEENCYLVEGYTDVISLYQAGIRNVVASAGTSLTHDQIKLIRRYTPNVTVLYDGDAAGIRASFRGIDMLLENDMNVRVVLFPDGEDPDSYSRKLGNMAIQHFLKEKAEDFIEFKTHELLRDSNNDPLKKATAIHSIVESISKIKDGIKRSVYVQKCGQLLQVEESILISEINRILLTKPAVLPDPLTEVGRDEVIEKLTPSTTATISAIENQEMESLRLLLNYGGQKIVNEGMENFSLLDLFKLEASELSFSHPRFQKLFKEIINQYTQIGSLNQTYFIQHPDADIQELAVLLLTPRYEISDLWKSKFQIHVPHESEHINDVLINNIMRFKFRLIQQVRQKELEKLKTASEHEIDQILDEATDLKNLEMEIARYLGIVVAK